ncbi:class I SAM-dependent methyltransferase [Microlunatus endophyticus]|uniref:class I SAM-dependent methyltransferase n=1 Tax=Microlunatus endophyticus TaxID=1716077 RepID=UPI001669E4CC|nr:class I SAM-dependent methyltransferase [Microlunatus endophyticus]
MSTVSEHTAVNRAFWDEVAPHHAASAFYATESFVDDPDSLGAIEKAELGPVAGLEICHLQCHIGLDTLSLARSGATVTGVDFSTESLRIARRLSTRTTINATFVESDVLDAAATLGRRYDLVFTSRGVLMWLGDLDRWARNCVDLIRPGGRFYLLDIHPLAMALEPFPGGYRLASTYFGGGEPSVTSEDRSYAVRDVGLTNQETHEWIHPVGAVVTALAKAGLVIDFLREHPGDDHTPTTLSSDSHDHLLPALFSVGGHLSQ